MPATTFAELFGAVFAPAGDVRLDVIQGPTGDEITGTLVVGGGTLPPSPETAIGQAITYSGLSVPEAGIEVSIQAVRTDDGRGVISTAVKVSETSDTDGLTEFVMLKGWTYAVWRGDLKYPQLCLVPTEDADFDDNGAFSINSLIGCPTA